MVKAFWFQHPNCGDTLGPTILQHFLGKVEYSEEPPRIISVGSIITQAKEGDIIWGAGLIRDVFITLPKVEVLVLRGPLTAHRCNLNTDVYGDPAILMPLIYKPKCDKIYKRGYVPHYADRDIFHQTHKLAEDEIFIDIVAPYKEVIDKICQCEEIISTSLHGIVLAEAYGIPAIYHKSYSGEVIGGAFKFLDYLLGTGREGADLYKQPIPPTQNIELRQNLLIKKLQEWYAKIN